MAEEIKQEEVSTVETNYIDVINNLKKNSVAKSEYERVLNDNKLLAEQLATSTPSATAEDDVQHYTQNDIDTLSSKLVTKNLTNLDYIKTVLDLRDACIDVHGVDPFLPNNSDYVVNEMDKAKAQNIADGLRHIAEYSGNDAQLFNSELKRCCK